MDSRVVKAAPYLLSLPALLLFAAIVVVPLVMTVLLSFHDWGQYKGIEPVLILKNWKESLRKGMLHFGTKERLNPELTFNLLIYQHLLVKPNDLGKVNLAFFTTNGIASVLFAMFVILDLFLKN